MRISKEKVYLLMLGALIAIGFYFCQFIVLFSKEKWEFVSAIFTMIEIIYLIISFKVLKRRFLSLSFLFTIALILFHLGNVIVTGFNLYTPEYSQNLMIYRYGEDAAKPAVIYSIWYILFFIIGCILFSQKEVKKKEKKDNTNWFSGRYNACKITGLILIAFSILPSFYVLFLMANTRLASGYAEIYNVDYSFFGFSIGWLTNLLIPGVFLFLVGINNNKKLFLRMTNLVVIYYVIYMFLSGRRADGLLVVLSVLILRNHFYKIKIKLSSILLCWILLVAITFIAQTRAQTMSVSEMLFSFLENIFHFDILWDFLLELGGTIRSPILIIETMDVYPQYRFGLTYLLSPIASLLNGLRISSSLNDFISFYSFLSSSEIHSMLGDAINNMGGSAIAEWYFNFGSIGCLFVPILSKGMLYIEKKSETLINLPFLQAFCFYSIYWILRYSRGFFAEMMWILIFTMTVSGFIYNQIERKINIHE